jgi:hypothetical protein
MASLHLARTRLCDAPPSPFSNVRLEDAGIFSQAASVNITVIAMAAPKSPFSPLPTPTSVRLLSLKRGADSVIVGTLETWDINDPACPRYVTLSYVWGAPSRCCSIRLAGVVFPVLDTVYPLLEAICEGPGAAQQHVVNGGVDERHAASTAGFEQAKDGRYWIDSICINQDDLAERSTQVALMGRVYREAARTAVWLGTGDMFSEMAMDLFAELTARGPELQERFGHSDKASRQLPKDDPLMSEERWEAWRNLLQHRLWWRRVWTLQEFILSKNLDFHCGPSKRISREQFIGGMWARKYIPLAGGEYGHPDSDDEAWLAAWNRRRLLHWSRLSVNRPNGWVDGIGPYGTGMGLVALLSYTADYFLSVPHDRVYALRGLLSDEEADALVPSVDYEVPVDDLLYQLVKRWITTYKSLDIICFAQLFRHPGASRAKFPSWVPDWCHRDGKPFVVPLMVSQTTGRHIGNFRPVHIGAGRPAYEAARYRADGGEEGCRSQSWWFDNETHRLSCIGRIIALNVPSWRGRQDHLSWNIDGSYRDPASLLRVLDATIRCMVLGREDRYLAKPVGFAQAIRFRREYLQLAAFVLDRAPAIPPAGISAVSAPHAWFGAWLKQNVDVRVSFIPGYETLGSITSALLDRAHNPQTRDTVLGLVTPTTGASRSASISDLDFSRADETSLAARLYDTTHPSRMGKKFLSLLHATESRAPMLAMGPEQMQEQDYVYVVQGCSVPVALRNTPTYERDLGSIFVGECYVDGIMEGEVATSERTHRHINIV